MGTIYIKKLPPISAALETKFRSLIERRGDNDCWPWGGNRSHEGYGRICMGGDLFYAHRIAWALANGRAPQPHEVIRHECDNPSCVNPRHLLSGSHLDNMNDQKVRRRGSNIRKTHCPKGHPYSTENTRIEYSQGTLGPVAHRKCRICGRARMSAAHARRKEAENHAQG